MMEKPADLTQSLASSLLDIAESISDNLEKNRDVYGNEKIQEVLVSIEKITDIANDLNDISIDASLDEIRLVVDDIEEATENMVQTAKRISKFEDLTILTLRLIGFAISVNTGAGLPAIAGSVREFLKEGRKIRERREKSA